MESEFSEQTQIPWQQALDHMNSARSKPQDREGPGQRCTDQYFKDWQGLDLVWPEQWQRQPIDEWSVRYTVGNGPLPIDPSMMEAREDRGRHSRRMTNTST